MNITKTPGEKTITYRRLGPMLRMKSGREQDK